MEYADVWNDLMVSYGGLSITYDAIGNPLTYGTYSYTWNGRQLESIYQVSPYVNTTYKYNDEGIRTEKIYNGVRHEYSVSGGQINREVIYSSNGQYVVKDLRYYYDAAGNPAAIRAFTRTSSTAEFTSNIYYLLTNMQGDVIAIYNQDGERIFEYAYDAWGNILRSAQISTGGRAANQVNPFRYRGYYYDTETGLYYLQSRYYNPQWGRFLNADYAEVMSDNGSLSDKNLFVYCDNNPVMRKDEDGEFWNILIGAAVGFVVGAGVSIVTQAMAGELDFTSGKTWAHIGISALSGTITGGFAASGVPLGGQIIANSVCGMLSSVADTAIDHIAGDTKSFSDYALNALEGGAFGAVAGYFGGSGTATPHLTSAFNRAMSNGNWGYYFTQIGKEAVKAGKRAVPAILIGTTPTLTKSTAKMTRRLIECYG